MPVTIRIEHGSDITAAQNAFKQIMHKLGRPDPKRSVKYVAELWAANYRQEGAQVGGWVQLAQSTIEERERQGFPGSHPILIRQGSLYAMSTLYFMQGRQGTASAWSTYGRRSIRTTASLEFNGGTAVMGLSGPKTVHQKANWTPPRRQYWFTNRNTTLAARLGVIEWIRDEVIPK